MNVHFMYVSTRDYTLAFYMYNPITKQGLSLAMWGRSPWASPMTNIENICIPKQFLQ